MPDRDPTGSIFVCFVTIHEIIYVLCVLSSLFAEQ
jgi:hypothetical protein